MNSIGLRKQNRLIGPAFLGLLVCSAALAQQQADEATAGPLEPVHLSEAPVSPAVEPTSNPPTTEDKRILGVLPNYRTANGTIPFQPITAKYKLTIAAKDSFDWPNYLTGAAFAGLYQLEDSHPSFGQGVAGYARRFGTSYADQVIGNMLTEGFLPVVLHEDPRYFRKVNGRKWGRAGYALTRVLIAKNDSGKTIFNAAEVLGNGIGASISNFYYPDERGFSDTMTRMGTQIATDALSNVLKEFWPDIKRHVFKRKTAEEQVSSFR